MNEEAYVLVLIDIRQGKVEGVGIYSEETPTTLRGYVYAKLFSAKARDFHAAHRDARLMYARTFPDMAARFPIQGRP